MFKNKDSLLVVTTSYPLTEGGVSGVFVKRLNETLSNYFCVRVICPSSINKPEIDVKEARYAPRVWQVLAQQPGGLPVALKKNKFLLFFVPFLLMSLFINVLLSLKDAKYLLSHWSLSGLISGVANLFFKRKSIVVFHGSDAVNLSRSFVKKTLAWVAIKLNDNCIGVSEEITNNLKTMFPELSHKIHFIPNGVSSRFLDIPVLKNDEVINLVTVSNLNPLKGVADILYAFKKLEESNVCLNIVGDGAIRTELENLTADLGLENCVKFYGNIAPDEIPLILSENQIFILASYSEGRPSVILEAMAAGKAVVATKLPGILELIEDKRNGLLFNAGNVESLSLLLSQLLKDHQLISRLGAAAKDSIINRKLSWEETAEQYQLLLTNL